jgi:membrane protease YdiL (CAAX protease family)
LPLFFALAYVFAWLLLVPAMLGARGLIPVTVPPVLLIFPLGYTPALAALAVAWLGDGGAGVRRLGAGLLRWRVGLAWYLVAAAGPPALFSAALALAGAVGVPVASVDASPVVVVVALVVNVVVAGAVNGEEIAWRGYALPALQSRMTALPAALVLGVLESCFHLPLFLTPGTPQSRIPFVGFTVLSVALSVIFAWVFNSTRGSLLVVTLLHAGINATTNVLPVPDAGPGFWITVLLLVLSAAIVVVATGALDLSRRGRQTWPPAGHSFISAGPGT